MCLSLEWCNWWLRWWYWLDNHRPLVSCSPVTTVGCRSLPCCHSRPSWGTTVVTLQFKIPSEAATVKSQWWQWPAGNPLCSVWGTTLHSGRPHGSTLSVWRTAIAMMSCFSCLSRCWTWTATVWGRTCLLSCPASDAPRTTHWTAPTLGSHSS